MEKNRTPVRKSKISTADLLTWSENSPATAPSVRSYQPSDGIQKVVFGGQVTDEEVDSINKRKPCSGYKLKEMTGHGIFVSDEENGTLDSDNANPHPNGKNGLKMYKQAVAGISQISFGDEDTVSSKKPVTLPEVAKQRELSGTLESESERKLKKQISDAKTKELSGHNIFAPPAEIQPRPLTARALALRENISIGEPASTHGDTSGDVKVIKTAKKIPNQKLAQLSGNDIFKGDTPPALAEKHLSTAKLREISGNNIFADGKVESKDFYGGVRKPPGGESSIALV